MVLNPERVYSSSSTPPTDRRAAALVALLALEGPLPRSRLAGLLWPEVPEQTARNNLSQTLRRLRQGGLYRLGGDARLTLLSPLDERAALALLAGHDYDDLSDLSDLLLALRERRLVARLRSLRAELKRAEDAGEMQAALDLTAVLLDLDPLHEATHRAAMRLHHLLGDRAGALAAYHRCKRLLRQELGLEPSAETLALAREAEQSAVHAQAAPAALPLSVRRPPRLIGREAAWHQMEGAWQEGKGIILSGEPGVGKTRLLRDFVAAHRQAIFFEGRPGDRLVPYSTHARTYGALLRQYPELPLPAWVRRELARIVPDLGDAPPPLASDADRLRFYQAKTETLRLAAAAGMGVVAFDDLQFVDEASVEAGEHSLSVFWGAEGGAAQVRTLHAYRSGELSADLEARIDALVSAGLAVRVRLSPLSPEEVAELLGSLGLPELAGRTDGLARASGGNPLLVLEGARHLLTGGEERALPTRMAALLGQRLERLSPAAMNLARAAAVLGPDLSPEAAGAMLGRDPLDLGASWAELEAAQVLRGRAFIHDLLSEGVLSGLPGALAGLLHRRAAAALEPLGAAPARIAQHWEQGEEPARAARWWLRAGDEAQQQYRAGEAAAAYGRAWDASADPAEAFGAGYKLARLLGEGEPNLRLQGVVERLLLSARTPAEHAAASVIQCQWLGLQGEGEALEAAAREGLTHAAQAHAAQAPDHAWEVELLSYLGGGLFYQRRLEEALEVFRQTADLADRQEHLDELAIATDNMATILGQLGRRQEALEPLRRVERRLGLAGRPQARAPVLIALANIDRFCGRQERARDTLGAAWTLLQQGDGAEYLKQLCLLSRAICARLLERHDEALALCTEAMRECHPASVNWPLLMKEQAHLSLLLGADTEARRCLVRVRQSGAYPQHAFMQLRCLEALLEVREGGTAEALLEALNEEARARNAPLSDRAAVALAFAPLLPAARRLDLTEGLAAETEAAELFGLRLAVLVCRARAHLALGRLPEAEAAMLEVLNAPEDLTPACSRAEVLYVRALVLRAGGHPDAEEAIQAAGAELRRVAAEQVPPEFRASYLARPLHRQILAALGGPAAWRPLTDLQWTAVQPLLTAPEAMTGRPRRDTRAVLDGVLWALSTGAAWNRAFPAHLPSAATCYRRYREWQASGVLAEVQRRLTGPPESADF